MSNRSSTPAATTATSRSAISRPYRAVRAIDAICFWLVLIVVAMRPLLPETYDSALHGVAHVISGGNITTPATTAWFDLAIWLAAVGVAISVAMRGMVWRWTGMESGAMVLLLAAVVSTFTAGNRRLAINASCDWLTAIVLVMVLANLCRSRLRIVLLLAAITASGVASAAKCGMQVGDEFATTREYYRENKVRIWQQQGIPLDDPCVELYERRLKGQEAFGFLSHPNTQGAWLALAGFAALGLGGLVSRFRRRWAAFGVLAAILFAAILTTGSKGAWVGIAVGLVLWLSLGAMGHRIRRHWPVVLGVAWVTVLAVCVGVVAWGISHGGLPTDSLRFRWNYWQVASKIITEHPWTGVGALNFSPAYLEHKPAEYPEEITDPHNIAVAVLSQWGIAGGVGLGLLLLGASVAAARAWGRSKEENTQTAGSAAMDWCAARPWTLLVVVGFLLLRFWAQKAWWQDGVSGRALVFFDLGFYGLLWAICFSSSVWLAARAHDGVGSRCRLACLAGIVLILLDSTINIALFTPGVLTPLAAMSAVLFADGGTPDACHRRTTKDMGPVVLAVAGLVALVWLMVIPVVRSSCFLDQARKLSSQSLAQYEQAAAADPLDPIPLVERAGLLAQVRTFESLSSALTDLNEALLRDPDNFSLYRRRSQLLERRYEVSGAGVDLLGAIGSARRVVELYPNSPEHRLARADLLVRAAATLDMPALIEEARRQYLEALALDGARAEHEIRRWSPARRHEVEERLKAIEVTAGSRPAISAPP